MKGRIAFLLLLAVPCGSQTSRATRNGLREQMHFSAEDESVKRPVAIPKSVLTTLKNDEEIRDVIANGDGPQLMFTTAWFRASVVHLSVMNRRDLVVAGAGPVGGANVNLFWIFRSTSHGYELVLKGPAHDLEILKTRWRGYRDIEMSAESSVQLFSSKFRFNGRRYMKVSGNLKPL